MSFIHSRPGVRIPLPLQIKRQMKKGFFNIIEGDDNSCTILMYGVIGDYEQVQASDIIQQLLEAEKKYSRINIRINSPGGEVHVGTAIFNAIKNSKSEIVIYVDGVAASMGAVLAFSGPRVEASKYAKFMLHSASGYCYGNRQEMEKHIAFLEEIDNTLCKMLAAKCGKTEDEIRDAYFDGQDHWLTAQEALEAGLIDAIYDAEPVIVPDNSSAEDVFALFYDKFETTLKPNDMYDKLKNRARFAACANDADVLKIVDELESEAAKVPELEKTNGTLTSENKTLKEENDGHRATARAAQEAADEQLLQDSLRAGKIGALDMTVYRAALKGADRETTLETLKNLPNKRRVADDLAPAGGQPTESAWDMRMAEIREKTKR